METALIPYSDIERMGNAIAKSGLFGMKKPEEAIALMLIAQAEGIHPAAAARDYHIISGRPALKADAMLARFQRAGGSVAWGTYTDAEVTGAFSHPQGGSVSITWDTKRANTAGITGNPTWKKYPRQMLRARCISEGIRTIYPGVSVGIYTPEEVESFDTRNEPKQESKQVKQEALQVSAPVENEHIEDAHIITSIDTTVHDAAIDALVEEVRTAVNLDHLLEVWTNINTMPNRTQADNERLKTAKNKRKEELSAPVPQIQPEYIEPPIVQIDAEMFTDQKMDEIFGASPVDTKKTKKGKAA